MDLFEKIIKKEKGLLKHSHFGSGYFFFPKLEGELGSYMMFNGEKRLNWSLNDYLGLANHPEVRKVDSEAAIQYGLAYPMGSRMMSGDTEDHRDLEVELADFIEKEDVMLLNYGYQGVLSTIEALVDRNDVIIYDKESHACIVDGVRLHSGKRFVFAHNDMENLEKQLQRAVKITERTNGSILVITEGVFGMSGDMGNLKGITDFKKKYDFRILIDDAHGFGVMGEKGMGAGEVQGVHDQIDIYVSTFAKGMACIGAFVAADKDIIKYLRFTSRSQIFAKSLPLPFVMGLRKRLEILRNQPELREKLWTIVRAIQQGLKKNGFDLGFTQSPVTPVFLNGENVEEAAKMVIDLRETYKVFCSVVTYPVVPKGIMMFRIVPTVSHTIEDVNITVDAFVKCKQKLEKGFYESKEFTLVINKLQGANVLS